jgi:hypothetical protein
MGPTRARQHEIDTEGQRLLRNALPSQWVLREQTQDYGIDFSLEPFDATTIGSTPSGQLVAIQLKSSTTVRGSESPRLRTSSLRYFADRCTIPVFLITADVSRSLVQYCFMQDYLLTDQRWREQDTFTIQMPSDQHVGDHKSFRLAIASAHHFLRELRPGSIAAATKRRNADLTQLDNRLDYHISFDGKAEQIRMTPCEDIQFKMHFVSPDGGTLDAVRRLVEEGVPLDTIHEGITATIDGLGVVDPNTPIAAKIDPKSFPCKLALGNDVDFTSQVSLDGLIRSGSKYATATFKSHHGLAGLRFRFSRFRDNLGTNVDCSLEINLQPWLGSRILDLHDFGTICQLVDQAKVGKLDTIAIWSAEKRVIKSPAPDKLIKYISTLSDIVNAVRHANAVCDHLGINPVLPKNVSDHQWDEIDRCWRLLFQGGFCAETPLAELDFLIAPPHNDIDSSVARIRDEFTGRQVLRRVGDHSHQIFDENVVIPDIRCTIESDAWSAQNISSEYHESEQLLRVELQAQNARIHWSRNSTPNTTTPA